MKQNLKFLTAIRERGMHKVDFAKAVRDQFTFVPRVINGGINLDEDRKSKYARALGKTVQELFD